MKPDLSLESGWFAGDKASRESNMEMLPEQGLGLSIHSPQNANRNVHVFADTAFVLSFR